MAPSVDRDVNIDARIRNDLPGLCATALITISHFSDQSPQPPRLYIYSRDVYIYVHARSIDVYYVVNGFAEISSLVIYRLLSSCGSSDNLLIVDNQQQARMVQYSSAFSYLNIDRSSADALHLNSIFRARKQTIVLYNFLALTKRNDLLHRSCWGKKEFS